MADYRSEFSRISKRIIENNRICERCGAKAEEVHHKIALIYGGDNSESNLSALCRRCHAEWDLYEDLGMEYDAFLLTPSSKAIASALIGAIGKEQGWAENIKDVFLNIHDAERELNANDPKASG